MEIEDTSIIERRQTTEPLLVPSIRLNVTPKVQIDNMTKLQVLGYSVGHLQNDLCGACWFTFLLFYLKSVVFKGMEESGAYAGFILLLGQIVDGLCTPLVGYFSDKTNTRIGKRTPWYIGGFILTTLSWVFIFTKNPFNDWFGVNSVALEVFYYLFFPTIFNVGWAAVQVSHMSLVPSLTLSRKTRDKLNNTRNTFTYVANLYVLALALVLFMVLKSDYLQFRVLAIGSLAVGIIASVFFLLTVNEKKLTDNCRKVKRQFKRYTRAPVDTLTSLTGSQLDLLDKIAEPVSPGRSLSEVESPMSRSSIVSTTDFEKWGMSTDEDTGEVHLSNQPAEEEDEKKDDEIVGWSYWFKMSSFYVYGFVYMGCRLLGNLQSSLIIFYLQSVLEIAKGVDLDEVGLPTEFAIFPMIIYLSSIICSSFLKYVFERIGKKKTFTIGTFISLFSATVMMFLGPESKYFMYPVAVLLGIGQSIALNTGISYIGEVIGVKGSSGAFVFGAYSLLDKFSSGVAIYVVMNMRDVNAPDSSEYVRICTSLIPGASVLLAWILVMRGKAADYDAGDMVMGH